MGRAELDRESKRKILQFVGRHGQSLSRFLLLTYLSRHPRARFAYPCLSAALHGLRLDLREALDHLVEEGVVERQDDPWGNVLFQLTRAWEKREPVLSLAHLDWEQARRLAQLFSFRWPSPVGLAGD